MAEIGVSVAAKVAEYLVGPVRDGLSYFWKYKSNFKNLENEVQKIQVRREVVQHQVDESRRKGEDIEQHVDDWLERVKDIIDEKSEIFRENEQANMRCFKRLCPNLKKQYQHSKKAATKAKDVAQLHEQGKFDNKISYNTIPEEIWHTSIKPYEDFESRMSILKDILTALTSADVNTVEVYGMGGIGKTTLAREVGRQAEKNKLYDVVVFEEVSQRIDDEKIKNIQYAIADKLGLVFKEESESGRARKLHKEMMKLKSILVVLDNIWGSLDFQKVGIPCGDHRGCKLLLTASSRQVLLDNMESQVNFLVGVLNYKEAWNLFKKTAGACVEEPNFQSLATDIVQACRGVPIAIVTIAKALRNKHVCEWNNALQELRCPSTRNFEGVARETYSSIEFSYKQLKNEELKSTFLICSMMGNTHDASLGDLLKYCMGLGIFKSINTVEEARNRVSTFVQKLESSSLLLDTNNESFSMHDVVRDVARSIACRDQHAFTVTDNVVPRDWVDKDTLKNCTAISLHNISELPNDLECPQLKFFYMKATHHSFKIPDNFFSKMLELRVLHIIGVDLLSSPASLCLLVNLQTLYLERCKLGIATIDGGLKKLEVLSFYSSNIVQLAAEIGSLSQLRLLDLTNCSELTVIPPYVLSSLTQLEEVCMGNTSIKWEVEGLYVQRSNASLDELKRLPRLTALELHIGDVKILPKGLLSEKLKKYILVIGDEGHGWFNHTTNDISRTLILERITSTCFGDVVAERQSVNNFLHVLDREGFSELKHLRVNYNPCFFCIADFVESVSWDPFSLLESLVLSHLFNLEKVYNGQLGAESFHHLRIIKVEYCDELKNIFSFSTVGGLQKLQEIEVSCCANMKEIFAIGSEEDIINNEVIDEINYFNELRSITLIRLPRLISFCSRLISEGEVYTHTPFFNEKETMPPSCNFEGRRHDLLPSFLMEAKPSPSSLMVEAIASTSFC
ncbi:hypothetical protein EZV62_004438 [Acer yangbiense]|uniref:Uncharacterized protein n=1 Tax=Acer yangbiense TaxID=1000413 RepID=A0A5C7IJQ0_9ROSI|nr:hypothetical protein EZV62_004438 [Acer yangbiense]